jgi:hypothetical protein
VPVVGQAADEEWWRICTFARILPAGDLGNLLTTEEVPARVGLSMAMRYGLVQNEVIAREADTIVGTIEARWATADTGGLDAVLGLPEECFGAGIRARLEAMRQRLRTPLWLIFGQDRSAFQPDFYVQVCDAVNSYAKEFDVNGGLQHLSLVDSSMRAIERTVNEASPPVDGARVTVRLLMIGSENLYHPDNSYGVRLKALQDEFKAKGVDLEIELPTPEERAALDMVVMMKLKKHVDRGTEADAFNALRNILQLRARGQIDAWAVLTTDIQVDLLQLTPFREHNKQRVEQGRPPLLICNGGMAFVSDVADELLGNLHQDELREELRAWRALVAAKEAEMREAHAQEKKQKKGRHVGAGGGVALAEMVERNPEIRLAQPKQGGEL